MKYIKQLIVIRTMICGCGGIREHGKRCRHCSTKVPLRERLRKH